MAEEQFGVKDIGFGLKGLRWEPDWSGLGRLGEEKGLQWDWSDSWSLGARCMNFVWVP